MPNGIELPADEPFQRVEWLIQRAGWLLWAVVLLAGLLGLFGSGVLSNATAVSPESGIQVSYQRFLRYHQPAELRVTLAESFAQSKLKLNREFLDSVQIVRIEPEPVDSTLMTDGIEYIFASSESTNSIVLVFFEYERMGKCQGKLQLNDSQPVAFSQFAYP